MNVESPMKQLLLTLCVAFCGLEAAQARSVTRAHVGQERGERPVARAPVIDSPEFLPDTSRAWVPADRDQILPAIAFDGENYLVAWCDANRYTIWATRVTPSGQVLDPDGIRIVSADTMGYTLPTVTGVAYNDSLFMVVWHQEGALVGQRDVRAARVSRQGVLLDPLGIGVSTEWGNEQNPSVGSDSSYFLVLWADIDTGSWYIRGRRLNSQGQIVDTSSLVISGATRAPDPTAVGFAGGNYLVVWSQDSLNIRATRVTPRGIVLDTGGFVISHTPRRQQHLSLAYNGADYFVVWESGNDTRGWKSYGSRVSLQGEVLDSAGVALSNAPGPQEWPVLANLGDTFFAFWVDWRDSARPVVCGTRLGPDGVVVDTQGIEVAPFTGASHYFDIREPVLAAAGDGRNAWLAWTRWLNHTDDDIVGSRISPQGEVLDPEPMVITGQPNDQQMPIAAWDGTDFLAVWADHCRDSTRDIRAARIAPDGTVLDPAGFTVSGARFDQFEPAVSSDPVGNALATWADNRNGVDYDLYGARVAPDGMVLDTSGIPISMASRNQGPGAVAFGNDGYFVTWQDFRNSSWDVYGTRVTPDGAVLDSGGIPVSLVPGYQENPAIGWCGSGYLVVWQDLRNGQWDIYGSRVTTNGGVLDTAGIVVSGAVWHQEHPAIAWDGSEYLVVWQDLRNDTSPRVYCARVTAQGGVLDPEGIAMPAVLGDQKYPAVTFDGTDFIVVWSDSSDTSWNICGVRVSSAGQVTDTFPVVMQNGNQTRPALAHGAGDQLFLAYQGWAGTVGGKTYNTDRIWGKLGPFTGIGAEPSVQSRTCLLAVEPNPVRSACRVSFGLSRPGKVSLRLCDATGRFVKTLFEGTVRAGASDFALRTSDFPAGVYFLRFETPERQEARKLILTE